MIDAHLQIISKLLVSNINNLPFGYKVVMIPLSFESSCDWRMFDREAEMQVRSDICLHSVFLHQLLACTIILVSGKWSNRPHYRCNHSQAIRAATAPENYK